MIGGGRQVIGPAGPDIHQAGDDRQVRAGFEFLQIVPHHVRGRDAAAGAVDPQHYGGVAARGGHAFELFAEQGDGVFPLAVQPGNRLIEQQPVDVDQGDLPLVSPLHRNHR